MTAVSSLLVAVFRPHSSVPPLGVRLVLLPGLLLLLRTGFLLSAFFPSVPPSAEPGLLDGLRFDARGGLSVRDVNPFVGVLGPQDGCLEAFAFPIAQPGIGEPCYAFADDPDPWMRPPPPPNVTVGSVLGPMQGSSRMASLPRHKPHHAIGK